MKKLLLVILGPTAVGKTQVAIDIAKTLNVPIINADSRQIYREMSIGTAAPSVEEQKEIKHYFVGTKDLDAYYSASLYEQEVTHLLDEELFKSSNIAVMSGGSMMYIDAVCNGIDQMPTITDDIRTMLKERYENEGLESLLKDLKERDAEYYAQVDKMNPRRIMHALEICIQTGNTYSSYRKQQSEKKANCRPYDIIKIGLTLPREELFDKINRRTINMMKIGFLEEAKRLYPRRHLNALNTVGYKELFQYLDGSMKLDDSISRIQKNTRVYAKKQMTWFKRDESILWCHPQEAKGIIENEIQRRTKA